MNSILRNMRRMEKEDYEDNIYNGVYIPKEFRNKVLKHMILNYSKNLNSFSPPLLLGIQGPKGEGKSFMIMKVCEYYAIRYIPISGAEMCGNLEGDSIKKLMYEYETACINAATDRKFSCIVIEDFHKSIAACNQKKVSWTSNSDTLIGRIMNLADNPYMHGNRIPIIVTSNDFTSIYSPLTRNGRMEIFDWQPDEEEKVEIVYGIFKKFYPNINYDTIKQLVITYKSYDIAFFKTLVQEIFWGDCNSIIEEFHNRRKQFDLDNITDLVCNYIKVNSNLNSKYLLEFAEKRTRCTPKKYD